MTTVRGLELFRLTFNDSLWNSKARHRIGDITDALSRNVKSMVVTGEEEKKIKMQETGHWSGRKGHDT